MLGFNHRPADSFAAGKSMKMVIKVKEIHEEEVMSEMERIKRMAMEKCVLVFSKGGCCMCHVVKRLLCNLGVNPSVYEIDGEEEMEKALKKIIGNGDSAVVPAVFIGGQLIGGLDDLMACHISGGLVPRLKKAGALWL